MPRTNFLLRQSLSLLENDRRKVNFPLKPITPMSNIFILKNGEKAGPFSPDEINDQLQSGEIAEDAVAWMKGMGGWETLSCDSLKTVGVVIPSVGDDAPEPAPEPAPSPPEPEPEPAPDAREPKPAEPEAKPDATEAKPTESEAKPAAPAQTRSGSSSGEMNLVGCVHDAVSIVKENLVPCVLLPLFMILPVLRELVMVNFMTALKAAKAEGKGIGIGDLLKFDRLVDKFVGVLLCEICIGIGSILLFVPGLVVMGVLAFVPCVLADKPEIPFMKAFKGVLSYGKENILQQCVLASVVFGFNMAGMMLLGLGIFITLPITLAVTYLAYENCKEAVASHLDEQETS